MIRKLGERDRVKLLEYVGKEEAINLFIIGDIENFGFDSDFQEIWGDFTSEDEYKGVLLRYKDFFIVYGEENYDKERFAEMINNYENPLVVSGREDIIDRISPLLNVRKVSRDYFSELTDVELERNEKIEKLVEIAKAEDVKGICDLLNSIEEFEINQAEEDLLSRIDGDSGRVYIVKEDDKVVATASTTAENSKSAMIVGVCTDFDYRGKGYASACVRKLCDDLLKEGKTSCLFYDNPAAGKIYKRIGFKDIGKWTMLKLVEKDQQ